VSIELTTLASGIRVVTERMPEARSVSAGVWVGVGARDEPADLAGVSHFLEHLLFKGTQDRSARQIAEAVDRVGGDMNAFTAKEYTAYYARLPADQLALGLEVLGDVLTAPALRDADVESERQVILEELMMDEDSPEDRTHTLLYDALFPGHPLGRETAGERHTVEAITPEDVRAFFRRWYTPSAMVVAAAGALDHDVTVAMVERWFSATTSEAPPRREAPSDAVRPLSLHRRSTEQAHLAIGYRGMHRDDADREALDVMNHVLGGGMSSRLFDEIREKRGLVYSVYSSPSCYCDAGALTVYAGTNPDRVEQVLDLIDIELTRLATDGITDDEMAVALGYLTGSYVLGLEDSGSRMARIGGHVATRGSVRPVEEQLARYRAVGHADVERAIARVLDGPRALAAVGPVTKKRLAARTAG